MGRLSCTKSAMKFTIQVSIIMELSVLLAALIISSSVTCASKAVFRCPSNDDISTHPHVESCKKYYRCTFGQAEELACPCTLHFDSVSLSCTHAGVQCVNGTEMEKWNGPVSANDGILKMVPHQVVCSKYYLCLGNITVERRCAEGLLFDAGTNKCTYPGDARCHLDPWCPENDDLQDLRFFPDPENCARYSVCYNRTLHPLYCAEGLFFNVETQECTLPGWSNCKVRDVQCKIDSEYVPHPSKCQSYYECEIGFAFYRECEEGYYFTELELSCMPDNGECMQLPSSSSTEQPTTEEMTTTSVTESSSTSTTGTLTSTESGGGDGGGASQLIGGFNVSVFVTVYFLYLWL